jgi:hypothetical protein
MQYGAVPTRGAAATFINSIASSDSGCRIIMEYYPILFLILISRSVGSIIRIQLLVVLYITKWDKKTIILELCFVQKLHRRVSYVIDNQPLSVIIPRRASELMSSLEDVNNLCPPNFVD